jgi:tetratricopeptide (TPR) repeat protein
MERHVALVRLLRALAKRRPVLIRMDDLHWSRESASFVRHLLRQDDDLPVLVVATVRSDLLGRLSEEALSEALSPGRSLLDESLTEEARLIDDITSSPRTECIEVGRLDDDEQRQLIDQALDLDPALVTALVNKTHGTPLFALQMIGHLIETDALETTERGFSAAKMHVDGLPNDLGGLWRLRIRDTCETVAEVDPDVALETLEIAVALGLFVDLREWQEVCDASGLVASHALVDELARRGLARIVDGGWHFEFTTLQETLSRCGREDADGSAQRWRQHHARCAQMLAKIYAPSARGVALRRSRHLIESGQLREALAPLLQAEQEMYDAGDFAGSRRCLDRHAALVDGIDWRDDRDRGVARAMNQWRRARVLFATGSRSDAASLVKESLRSLRASKLAGEVGAAALLLARMLRDDGDLEAARPLFEEALDAYKTADDRNGVAHTRSGVGYLELMTGNHREALDWFRKAYAEFETLDNTLMRGRINLITGHTLLLDDQVLEGAIYVEEALRLTRLAGDRPTEAEALRCLGEIARARSDWAEAEHRYVASLDLHEICGTRAVHLVRVDLALTQLAVGAFSAARDLLEEAEQHFPSVGYGARLPFVYTALLACAAGLRDREAWQHYVELTKTALSQTQTAHRDIEWAAGQAADLARGASWNDAAEQAEALAQSQRERMG